MHNLIGDLVDGINASSALWGGLMLRASLSGGVVILLLWALCRAWPRLSPSGRSWLWRAVFCKLLLALFWQASVGVPLLPSSLLTAPGVGEISTTDNSQKSTSFDQAPLHQSSQSVSPPPALLLSTSNELSAIPSATPEQVTGNTSMPQGAAGQGTEVAAPLPPTPLPSLRWLSVALVLWLIGVVFLIARAFKAAQLVRRLRAGSQPFDDAACRAPIEELRRYFGLARAPELLRCPHIDAMALTGVRDPAILLPPQLAESLATINEQSEENETRLMLAHELAHQKRRDLAWNWLLWLGQTLFWFHPLVYLAAREWHLAQEVACDALAVRATQAPVTAYGAMLLKTAVQGQIHRGENLFAVGVGARATTLQRRLAAMKHFTAQGDSRRAVACCAVLALIVIVPWRLTARLASAQVEPHATAGKTVEAVVGVAGATGQTSPGSLAAPAAAVRAARRKENGKAVAGAFVQDPAGKPLKGATVVIRQSSRNLGDSWLSAQTDKLGLVKFRMTPPVSGERLRANATIYASGYALMSRLLEEGSYAVVRMQRSSSMRGLITNMQGRPLPGVAITLRAVQQGNQYGLSGGRMRYLFVEEPLEKQFTVRSDTRGFWTMPNLPNKGRADFEITDPRYFTVRFTAHLRADGAMAPPCRVMPGATVIGRLRLPGGQSAAGRRVYVGGDRSKATISAADGSYRVTGLGTDSLVRVKVLDPSGSWVAPVVRGLKTKLGAVTRVPDIALTRGSLLQGRVVDAVTGAPVAGAELTAHFDRPGKSYKRSSHSNFALSQTDAQGRYTLRVLPGPGTVSVSDYTLRGGGHHPRRDVPYTIGANESRTLTVRLKPALLLEGTARDEAGKSVRDAYIQLQPLNNFKQLQFWTLSSLITLDGTWRISGLSPMTARLKCHGPWEVVSPQRVTVPATKPVNVVLRRVALSSVAGRVVTPDGKPLPDAEVTVLVYSRGPNPEGYSPAQHLGTDAQGRFILRNLPRQSSLKIRAAKSGYALVTSGRVTKQGNNFVVSDIVLKRVEGGNESNKQSNKVVAGVFVQDPAGQPLQDATVIISAPHQRRGNDHDAWLVERTNKNGLVKFAVAPPVSGQSLRAAAIIHAPGYALASHFLAPQPYAVVRLQRGVSVRGLVTDKQERPLPGVAVRLRAVSLGNDYAFNGGASRFLHPASTLEKVFTVRSDAGGFWTMPDLPDNGRATFEIVDPRYYGEMFLVQLHAGQVVTGPRRLLPGATITGRIRFPDGKPAVGIMVSAGGVPNRHFATGRDGTYRVTGLGITTRVLVYDPSGEWVAPIVRCKQTQHGAVTRVPDIVLTRGALLQGRVVDDATGTPIAGASLTAFCNGPDAPPLARKYPDAYPGNYAYAGSNAAGRYTLRVLPGPGRLSVYHNVSSGTGHHPKRDLPYILGKGESRNLTIRLKPALALEGTARDEAGKIARDAVIVVQPVGKLSQLTNRDFSARIVEADGTWRINNLPRMTAKLDSRGPWEVVSPKQVTLPATKPINVILRPVQLLSLAGRVVTPDGKPIVDAEVIVNLTVKAGLGYLQTERLGTDAQGHFQLRSMRRETAVSIKARKSGYFFVSGGRVTKQGTKFVISDIVLKQAENTRP